MEPFFFFYVNLFFKFHSSFLQNHSLSRYGTASRPAISAFQGFFFTGVNSPFSFRLFREIFIAHRER